MDYPKEVVAVEGEQQMDTTLTNVSNEPDVDVEAVNMEVVVELPDQPHVPFFHKCCFFVVDFVSQPCLFKIKYFVC